MLQYNSKYIRKSDYKQVSNGLTFQEIISLIAGHTGYEPRPSRGNYAGRCPAHDDKHPSLSIKEGNDSRILLYCFNGCTIDEICRSLGIEVKDLFPKKGKGTFHG